MKEQLPPPDFDANHYVRPMQSWICGKSQEGVTCRIGPDTNGRCRATCECIPVLELKPGETKGHYRCTRPAEAGGPCEHGPLPNGTCCRAITRCQPVRSLRAKRKAFTCSIIIATFGLLLLALAGDGRWQFISPGELSSQHSGSGFSQAFVRLHPGAVIAGDTGCTGCHGSAHGGPTHWIKSALDANPGPLQTHKLALMTAAGMTTIDQNCQRCHVGHTFHQPNVVMDHSCSACHQEHLGKGLMKRPDDANCATCHADAQIMQASLKKGRQLSLATFDYRPDNGRQMFKAPRPERGYTQVIHSFATDHSEFQVVAEKLKDPDTLKFNHQLHLTSPTIPSVDGRKLDCADCHKPDASGIYHQKISFEANCRKCHSLQFDARNPDLSLPHGNPEFVRAFLGSLPIQYAEYGARKKGLTGKSELAEFVKQQMIQIREQVLNGENLEQQVFFSEAKLGPVHRAGQVEERGRALFPGCAYCHEVKPVENAAPAVTKPVIMDRWLRGGFNHGKHLNVDCNKCHEVMRSSQTSDILLPSKATCAECHSPKGGVRNQCSTCHSYHAPMNILTLKTEAPKVAKQE
ncbi:MAG: hypothetical protein JWQ71_1375 [Pedosphaera sp.]|nr:hypothetical protein [Pedosphaera sp.]